MATDLTTEVTEGFNARRSGKNPYLFSSDAWLAFRAGQEIDGMSGVRKARKSRGYSVMIETIGGNIVTVKFFGNALDQIAVDCK